MLNIENNSENEKLGFKLNFQQITTIDVHRPPLQKKRNM